jgi:hypothetical protein
MRNWILLASIGALFISCKDKKESAKKELTSNVQAEQPPAQTTPAVNPVEKFLGSYVGPFGDNKITMLIIRVTRDSVEGRTVVGGNDRPFTGTTTESNGRYSFHANEPGDDPDDGVFDFSILVTNPDTITGSWKPNNPKKPAKQYALQRKKFEYKPGVGEWPEASQRLLKADDVEDLPKSELEFMRNEIFARHGYCFKKKNLRQQFEMEEWYVPNTVDIKGYLTDVEKKNILLIKRYEKYAEDYGDEYGR